MKNMLFILWICMCIVKCVSVIMGQGKRKRILSAMMEWEGENQNRAGFEI